MGRVKAKKGQQSDKCFIVFNDRHRDFGTLSKNCVTKKNILENERL